MKHQDEFEVGTTMFRLSRDMRWAMRRARIRSNLLWLWVALKADPRHPIETYRDFKRASDNISRDIERRMFFGDSAL